MGRGIAIPPGMARLAYHLEDSRARFSPEGHDDDRPSFSDGHSSVTFDSLDAKRNRHVTEVFGAPEGRQMVRLRRLARILLALSVIGMFVVGAMPVIQAASVGLPVVTGPRGTLDELFGQVAAKVPEFGGMYRQGSTWVVYLTNPARQAAAVAAIQAVFGSSFDTRGGVRVLPATYGFGQLAAWHARMGGLFNIRGVLLTDHRRGGEPAQGRRRWELLRREHGPGPAHPAGHPAGVRGPRAAATARPDRDVAGPDPSDRRRHPDRLQHLPLHLGLQRGPDRGQRLRREFPLHGRARPGHGDATLPAERREWQPDRHGDRGPGVGPDEVPARPDGPPVPVQRHRVQPAGRGRHGGP